MESLPKMNGMREKLIICEKAHIHGMPMPREMQNKIIPALSKSTCLVDFQYGDLVPNRMKFLLARNRYLAKTKNLEGITIAPAVWARILCKFGDHEIGLAATFELLRQGKFLNFILKNHRPRME